MIFILTDHEVQLAAALDRALLRFHREGPFVFDRDDPDAEVLRAAGKRVTYVDEGSIVLAEIS